MQCDVGGVCFVFGGRPKGERRGGGGWSCNLLHPEQVLLDALCVMCNRNKTYVKLSRWFGFPPFFFIGILQLRKPTSRRSKMQLSRRLSDAQQAFASNNPELSRLAHSGEALPYCAEQGHKTCVKYLFFIYLHISFYFLRLSKFQIP